MNTCVSGAQPGILSRGRYGQDTCAALSACQRGLSIHGTAGLQRLVSVTLMLRHPASKKVRHASMCRPSRCIPHVQSLHACPCFQLHLGRHPFHLTAHVSCLKWHRLVTCLHAPGSSGNLFWPHILAAVTAQLVAAGLTQRWLHRRSGHKHVFICGPAPDRGLARACGRPAAAGPLAAAHRARAHEGARLADAAGWRAAAAAFPRPHAGVLVCCCSIPTSPLL